MSPPQTSPYLSLRDVSVIYSDGYQALQPTSLDVAKGEFLVLLGASGAGKSTLLRSINRLVTTSAGTITLADLPDVPSSLSRLRQLRRQCAMVFQQHHLIGRQTVLSNVLMGLLASKGALATIWPWSRSDKLKALAVIDRVGLLDKALARADQLSGGQQQRVGIARALVQAPKLLLADEPVASLDPATAHSVLSLLHEICKLDGLTALVSLHQVELAQTFADRVVGLRQGTIVFDASPDQLIPEVQARLYTGSALITADSPETTTNFQSERSDHHAFHPQESQPC
jgi:phosphonate transport system ATP-binding protein